MMGKKNTIIVAVIVIAVAALLAWYFMEQKAEPDFIEPVATDTVEDTIEINNTVQTAVTVLPPPPAEEEGDAVVE